jgi:hypothetical protein
MTHATRCRSRSAPRPNRPDKVPRNLPFPFAPEKREAAGRVNGRLSNRLMRYKLGERRNVSLQ